mgnify:FL=1
MQYFEAICYNCIFYKSGPRFIGDSGKCSKYPMNIPRKIYYKACDCEKFVLIPGHTIENIVEAEEN